MMNVRAKSSASRTATALALALFFTHSVAAAAEALPFDLKEYERPRVIRAADKFLGEAPLTITAYPAARSAGGLHDYYSEADYAWPDPKSPSGPYVTRDGMSNPDNFNDHRHALIRMSIQVPALTAAWMITGDEKYSRHAVAHLRAWFVDEATRMNPSLLYSQAIRNKVTGRGIGIIDMLHLVEVARSVEVLRRHGQLSKENETAIVRWFADYLKWMTTHPYGIDEGKAKNNHAVCFWLQVAAFAQLTGNQTALDECRRRYKEQLLPQIAADGSFPRELARTKPYGYSLFNLDQMTMLCRVLSAPDDDLWTFKLSDGRSIRNGPEFMYPFVKDKSTWPYKADVMYFDQWPVRSCTWLFAGLAFHEPSYIDLWKHLNSDPTNDEVIRNLPIRQPVIWFDDAVRATRSRIRENSEVTASERAGILTNSATSVPTSAEIRTPKPPATPRINGPRVYGERPGRPFLYTIPATGKGPLTYSAEGLPDGLTLDAKSGRITGKVDRPGEYRVALLASNALGRDRQSLTIKIGDQICLTPPLGWNSWNCFGGKVDQEKVAAQARAMASSGLIQHGWTYINIDDTWQGHRSGPDHVLQPNEKFPDMKRLCNDIHALGLKAGIYSTPWVTSYARRTGGSAENPEGEWEPPPPGPKQVNKKVLPYAVGKFHFMTQDARQWAQWSFDYLKYDWNPIEAPDVEEMAEALKASGRDFVYSLSNNAPFSGGPDYVRLANLWRTTGDIKDNWKSMSGIGFRQEKWAPLAGPGHWNDPDMLVVGMVGWGKPLHPTQLTADEQYTHITLWCLLSAPLLIGCDLTQVDDFTLGLLTNDEVLAVDQDPLGREATPLSKKGGQEVWAKPLADGAWAVGLFNRDDQPADVKLDLADLKLTGPQRARDVWRQRDLSQIENRLSFRIAAHGAELLKVGTPK
jgi:alpha-galactosidase